MNPLLTSACALLVSLPAFAGSMEVSSSDSKKSVLESCPPVDRLLFRATSSYVSESDFERGNDASGDAWMNDFQVGYRIPLGEGWPNIACGEWDLRLGARYTRFDFSHDGGLPIPNHLQGIAGVIALEYLVRNRTAIILETRPGVYFENDIRDDSFDAPTVLASAFRVTDTFTGVLGVSYAGLRSYPFLPAVGFIWDISDHWTLNAVVPEPRLTYKATANWEFWAGGELAGGAFRVDRAEGRPAKLDNGVVTYSEYRASVGVTYQTGRTAIDVGAGYAFQREFDFHRADEEYQTDEGAPFIKVELRAGF